MGKARGGVRRASATSIEIDFYFRGARCKERLKLAPTKANLSYAERLRGTILNEIALGTFDYGTRFPQSRHAKIHAKQPGSLKRIDDTLWAWLETKRPELEHSTAIEYERAIRGALVPAFGKLQLGELTRQHVKAWLSDRPSLSAKHLNNTLSPLRQMLAEAVEDCLIESDPMLGLRVKRKRKQGDEDDVDPFTPDEMLAILAKLDGQVANLVRFTLWTGLRTSELISLKWRDVDLEAGCVRVRSAFVRGKEKSTKTASGNRIVPLFPEARAALVAQQHHTQHAGGVVFHNPRTGRAWVSGKALRDRDWTAALKSAEVRYRYPYQLRHTFASMLLSAGENVMWVARMLGHKSWTMTATKYARWLPSLAPDAGAKAVAAWERSTEKVDQNVDQIHTKPHQPRPTAPEKGLENVE